MCSRVATLNTLLLLKSFNIYIHLAYRRLNKTLTSLASAQLHANVLSALHKDVGQSLRKLKKNRRRIKAYITFLTLRGDSRLGVFENMVQRVFENRVLRVFENRVLRVFENRVLRVFENRVLRVFENRVLRKIFGPKSVADYIMRTLMISNPHQILFG